MLTQHLGPLPWRQRRRYLTMSMPPMRSKSILEVLRSPSEGVILLYRLRTSRLSTVAPDDLYSDLIYPVTLLNQNLTSAVVWHSDLSGLVNSLMAELTVDLGRAR
jgi:hypothetical protein